MARANDSAYGLNASVWSTPRRGRRVAARLQVGSVNVNEGYTAAWGSHDAPIGGMKESGLGRRHGAEGLLAYTEPQTTATQRLLPLGPLPHVEHELWGRWMARGVRAMPVLRALPTGLFDRIADILGVNRMIDRFDGRSGRG